MMEPILHLNFNQGEPSIIRVEASNGIYSGYTEAYINDKRLSKLAEDLDGFPKHVSSEVVFRSGLEDECELSLRFFSDGRIGKTAVRVTINYRSPSANLNDKAEFTARFEPASLDRFLTSLRTIIAAGEGSANLFGSKNT